MAKAGWVGSQAPGYGFMFHWRRSERAPYEPHCVVSQRSLDAAEGGVAALIRDRAWEALHLLTTTASKCTKRLGAAFGLLCLHRDPL